MRLRRARCRVARRVDLLLLHPPSVYDFRKRAIFYGPISDLIPSSTVFEMYPLGFLTMVSHLEKAGWRTRIVNLGVRMIKDPDFDVPTFLAKHDPMVFGIDLHWMPHAHGALEVAKLAKAAHPDTPVLLGGLSATYYHHELVSRPEVDFVLRGDTIEPPLTDLMACLADGKTPDHVPDLTWHDGQRVRVNAQSFTANQLDDFDVEPERLVRMVLRHADLRSVLPFSGWWQNPVGAVFLVKGCSHACVTCGASAGACALMGTRKGPVHRSPTSVVRNVQAIARLLRAPIYLVGDPLQAGPSYADELVRALSATRVRNEIGFEYFGMPPDEHFEQVGGALHRWSVEMSPESHDEAIRRVQDRTTFYSNKQLEASIDAALAAGASRVDLFFMIGLPGQDEASVQATIDYCAHLFETTDKRLSCFISPMGPFLDPASSAFEKPESLGYKPLARTLEEHREHLVAPTWRDILTYETDKMDRDALVRATYDAGERLNQLKLDSGRIDPRRGREVAARIAQARELAARLDRLHEKAEPDPAATRALMGDMHTYSMSSVCHKEELFRPRHLLNYRLGQLTRLVLGYYAGRLVGRDRLRRRVAPAEL